MSREQKKVKENKALHIGGVAKLYFLTKDRQGNYQILNELAYEKKLIYGYR